MRLSALNLSLSSRAIFKSAVTKAAVVPTFTYPPFTLAKYDGDSRTANAGGRGVGTTMGVTTGMGGVTHLGFLQSLLGNPFLLGEGYNHAVGGSTTLSMLRRSESTSMATSGNPAATEISSIVGNYGTPGAQAADGNFAFQSDGMATVRTQTGGHVISASVSVNDGGGAQASYYNNPVLAAKTMQTIADYADRLIASGKTWIVGNEIARGGITVQVEAKTLSGNSFAAANTNSFQDGEQYGAPGVIAWTGAGLPKVLTKVASNPGQDQYTVDASGNYVVGGTAPSKAWLNYNYGNDNASGFHLTMRDWFSSSAPNFTSDRSGSLIDYGIPGFQYNRPQHIVVDSFGATVDPTTGTRNRSLPGMLDNLSLHGNQLSSLRWAKAAKAAIIARYGALPPPNDTRPTRNNWYAFRSLGANPASGTLPPSMRKAVPTIVSINGVPVGKVDLTTGAITGPNITSGSLNFATGAWTMTVASIATTMPVNAQVYFEQDIGNFDVATMTEGTIGRNIIANPLMEIQGGGTSQVTGIANSQIPDGWTFGGSNSALNDMLAAGTGAITVFTDVDADGLPLWGYEVVGIHTAGMTLRMASSTVNGGNNRAGPSPVIMAGIYSGYRQPATGGRMYGTIGRNFQLQLGAGGGGVQRVGGGGSTTVTNFQFKHNHGSTGMYLDDGFLKEAGGSYEDYAVTPLIDVSDVSFGTTQALIAVATTANVPFAIRIVMGRAMARRRSDVAKY